MSTIQPTPSKGDISQECRFAADSIFTHHGIIVSPCFYKDIERIIQSALDKQKAEHEKEIAKYEEVVKAAQRQWEISPHFVSTPLKLALAILKPK